MTDSVKVLIVDDDEVDRESMCRAFKEAHIANPLVTARDGLDALEILRGTDTVAPLEKPYFVLLDLNMPRMNGLEFLKEIRDDPNLSDTLVMVLSTSNSDKDKIAAYGLKVAGYITKRQAADDFSLLAKLLNVYWRLIEFPP